MRSSLGLVFLGLVCVALAHGGHDHSHDDDGHSHVVVLDPSNFDEEVAKADVTLVEFYAPWCGHCKKLAPEFDKASNALVGTAGALAKIDCDDKTNKPACDKYGVRGYPTLKVFHKGGAEPVEYPGGRTADAIVKFMKKQLQPAFTQVATEDEVKALSESAVAVVAFAEPESPEAAAFKAVAQQLRNDYTFAIAPPALAAKFGAASAPAVVVLKPSEEAAVYAGEWEQAALAKWVGDEAFPVFGEIGPDTYQKYLDRNLPLAWFFVDVTAADFKATGKAIGTEFKGKVSATYLDGVRWADHAKQMGAKSGPPSVVIEDRENDKRYVLQGEEAKSLDAVRGHVQAFLDGKLEPTLKSEEPPADNSGPVKVVVGKTFQDIVMDDSKDVMVEFYAPWCGHCKTLAPKYEELGKLFAKDASIVIAKVDATENDTPAPVKGFPTLIFYPAGDKGKPQTYSGERTVDAMAKFIREHATTLSNKEDL